jgi:hypothetical protein
LGAHRPLLDVLVTKESRAEVDVMQGSGLVILLPEQMPIPPKSPSSGISAAAGDR